MADIAIASAPGGAPLTQDRLVGGAFIALAAASVLLLMGHPAETARTFADVLKEEAANQGPNAAVHGGFILVLSLEFIGFAALATRLGARKMLVLAALVFTAVGFTALSGSMVIDGLVTPAVAAKYASAPDKAEFAKALFVLFGTLIRFLMPLGLAFGALGTVCWGGALLAARARATGALGLAVGGGTLAALAATFSELNPVVLMGALAAQALWVASVGVLFLRAKV